MHGASLPFPAFSHVARLPEGKKHPQDGLINALAHPVLVLLDIRAGTSPPDPVAGIRLRHVLIASFNFVPRTLGLVCRRLLSTASPRGLPRELSIPKRGRFLQGDDGGWQSSMRTGMARSEAPPFTIESSSGFHAALIHSVHDGQSSLFSVGSKISAGVCNRTR